ncbi:hypothetical protein GUJ93_ZPchr0496g38044 [Zizania palustris]|uniref:Ubiquitin-like protease family profile domain-containing protein n=1 Tax=Zizania palustris TaxID=103762 RepID=A0A8J5RED2_ZIZPA|nr:hypothetical protein GUJ93_ZPchr0496g38044 [Zizania palustris]
MSDKVNQKVRTAVRKVPLSRFETPLNIERPSLQHGNVSSGDDDFVAVGQQDVEQTNVEKGKKRAGMKSKATRSPRRKHVNVEKGKKMNYLTTRCAPSLVVGLRNSLHHGIEESVRNIGFGHILEFKLDGIDDRAHAFFLMNHIRDEPLSIVVGSKVLPINAAAVHAVLGIPIGGVKCFMMAVFNALLFPTSILNINGSDFLYCKEIMRMGEFDWCQAVVDDIRDKVDRWRKNRDKATPLVQGCIAFIMQKMEFLSALELHDKDVDDDIIKINEAHKDIEEAQQKFASEIKHMFGDLVGHSLNTESPRDIRRKRRAERPLGGSSLNVKRKSQIPRDVSPVHIDSGDDCPEIVVERSPQSSAGHIDSGDDCPEIVVERSPQSSAGQSSFEQQEVAHAPSDTHVQHEVEQTVTVESVHEEVSLRKEYDIKEAAALTGEKVLLSACSWGLPYIDVPKQVLVTDCGFFVMCFWNTMMEKGTQYRAELMYYLCFHKMNEARGHLLNGLNFFAPGKTEHNVSKVHNKSRFV